MSVTVQESEEHDRPTVGPDKSGPLPWLRRAWRRAGDEGMAAAEYAIVTMVGCAFAGLLLAVLTSAQVRTMLSNLIKRALTVA